METQKVFVFDKINVFFKHTDYFGCVHPYNYFEWTSYVREAFFQETVPNFREVIERDIKMMTTKIQSTSLGDAHFGDSFEARLTVGKIKKVSFDMIIRFFNCVKKQVSCETLHTVVFVDFQKGDFANIPEEMSRVIINYQGSPVPRSLEPRDHN